MICLVSTFTSFHLLVVTEAGLEDRHHLVIPPHLSKAGECYNNIPESNLPSESTDSNHGPNLILIFSIALFCQSTFLLESQKNIL